MVSLSNHALSAVFAVLLLSSVVAQPRATETATFAGGCFWSMEHVFDDLPGVVSVTVGYAGGSAKNPSYERVEMGVTGHAESVQVVFDPKKITYDAARRVLAQHRSYRRRGPVLRSWHAVSTDHLLRRRGPEAAGRAVEGGARPVAPIQTGDAADRLGVDVLARRRGPPAFLQDACGAVPHVSRRLRPRRAAAGALGQEPVETQYEGPLFLVLRAWSVHGP